MPVSTSRLHTKTNGVNGELLDAVEFAQYILNRKLTFTAWPHVFPRVEDLLRAGFEYAGQDDAVRCVYCNIQIRDWKADKHPLFVHRDNAIGCPFMNNILNCSCSEHIFLNKQFNYELRRSIRQTMESAQQDSILLLSKGGTENENEENRQNF